MRTSIGILAVVMLLWEPAMSQQVLPSDSLLLYVFRHDTLKTRSVSDSTASIVEASSRKILERLETMEKRVTQTLKTDTLNVKVDSALWKLSASGIQQQIRESSAQLRDSLSNWFADMRSIVRLTIGGTSVELEKQTRMIKEDLKPSLDTMKLALMELGAVSASQVRMVYGKHSSRSKAFQSAIDSLRSNSKNARVRVLNVTSTYDSPRNEWEYDILYYQKESTK